VKPHVFHPEADAEYAEAAQHYFDRGENLGGRFFDESSARSMKSEHRLLNSALTIHRLDET